MKLFNFLPKENDYFGENKEITNLSCDSRKVKENGLFFCLNGTNYNGETYANEAIKNGAVAIVSENKLNLDKNITQIIVPSARSAMSEMASHYYGDPGLDMLKIAVTGTNGKTTTTYLLNEVLTKAGYKVGVIGTNGTFCGKTKINSQLTTPDPIELFAVIKQLKDLGCDCLCYEASAHAIALNKLDGLESDISLLTNISQDHLDYFKTMFNYASAKAKLFNKKLSKTAIINTKTPLAKLIYDETKIPKISIGESDDNDLVLKNVNHYPNHQEFMVDFKDEVKFYKLNMVGKFNAENALGVIAVAEVLGIDRNLVYNALKTISPVPGRFNFYEKNGVKVIVDFAHTPEAMANALTACREIVLDGGKLFCVFGCGGNRDAGKRPLMGKTAAKFSDHTIITSDNPRYESPKKIIDNIICGLGEYTNYSVEEDRAKAITKALEMAKPGDVVAVLGKGCENYIDQNGIKTPYSDQEVILGLENQR